MNNPFDVFLVFPIINVLVAIYKLLLFAHLPYPLGFSIIGLTVVIRLILYPLTSAQLNMSSKMQKVAPHISKLKEKHKGDAKRLQQETMKLYKEHGVNPAAGCLPIIIQLPLIWALYSVLQNVVSLNQNAIVAYINKIVYTDSFKLSKPWDQSFFGLPLGQHPSNLISVVPLIVFLPLVTAFLQFIQSKMMLVPKPVGEGKDTEKNLPAGKAGKGDFASAFQSQSLYIFPVMIGFFSYSLPIGLSLYWNTFTIFGILQQYRIQGLGGLKPWIERFKK